MEFQQWGGDDKGLERSQSLCMGILGTEDHMITFVTIKSVFVAAVPTAKSNLLSLEMEHVNSGPDDWRPSTQSKKRPG